jgi:hypothetical protein
LALVSALTFAAVYLGLAVTYYQRSRSERLLAAGLVVPLSIQLEIMLLSVAPVGKPLRYLPILQPLLAVVAIGASARRLRSRSIVGTPRHLRPDLRNLLSRLSIVAVAAGVIAALVLLFVTGWGFATAPASVDELAYHVPQALGIHQFGRLVRFDNPLPWVYAYPQGSAMLWAWTVEFTKSDIAFHAVQAALGAQLLLAVYVLARRSNASRDTALLIVATLSCMPVFFRVTTLSTSDIGYAAAILTMLAFLAPATPDQRTADYRLAALAFAEACLVKLPVVATLFAVIGAGHAFWNSRRPHRAPQALRLVSLPNILVALICVAALSTYAVNLVRYGNPAYPLELKLPGMTLAGPLPTVSDKTLGAHTTFGEVGHMNRAELWFASLFDWGQPLNEDSLGSFGPAAALPMMGLALGGMALAIRRRDSWTCSLASITVACFLGIPGLFLPRYGLGLVAVLGAIAAVTLARKPRLVPAGAVVLLVCSILALLPVYRSASESKAWLQANSAPVPWWRDRGRSISEHVRLGDPWIAQSPSLVRYVRYRVRPRTLLVWNISAYSTFLWNKTLSNRIKFLPGSVKDRYPTEARALTPPTPVELDRWLESLRKLDPEYVVVYTHSAYPTAVKGAGLPYAIDFEDAPSDGLAAVTVLRRL